MSIHTSLVVPVFNESGNILPLVEVAHRMLCARGKPFEMIFVDDGSTDDTAAELASAAARFASLRVLTRPHAGQADALLAGLAAADGEVIATMDGDGQNDPHDLPGLLDRLEAGDLDMICGWRRSRHDPWVRRIMSGIANRVRRRILADGVHDAGCQLRAFRAVVRGAFFPMELAQSFLPAMAAAAGYRVGEVPVRHHARTRGVSKYGLGRLWWRPAAAMLRLRRELRRRHHP